MRCHTIRTDCGITQNALRMREGMSRYCAVCHRKTAVQEERCAER